MVWKTSGLLSVNRGSPCGFESHRRHSPHTLLGVARFGRRVL